MAGQRCGARHRQASPAGLRPPAEPNGRLQAPSRADGRGPRTSPASCSSFSFAAATSGACLVEGGVLSVAWVMQDAFCAALGGLAGTARTSVASIEPDRRPSGRRPAAVCQARRDCRHPLWFLAHRAGRARGVPGRRSARRRALVHRRRHGHRPLQRSGGGASLARRAASRRLPARSHRAAAAAVSPRRRHRSAARDPGDVRHKRRRGAAFSVACHRHDRGNQAQWICRYRGFASSASEINRRRNRRKSRGRRRQADEAREHLTAARAPG